MARSLGTRSCHPAACTRRPGACPEPWQSVATTGRGRRPPHTGHRSGGEQGIPTQRRGESHRPASCSAVAPARRPVEPRQCSRAWFTSCLWRRPPTEVQRVFDFHPGRPRTRGPLPSLTLPALESAGSEVERWSPLVVNAQTSTTPNRPTCERYRAEWREKLHATGRWRRRPGSCARMSR